jgi:hypothetical protein
VKEKTKSVLLRDVEVEGEMDGPEGIPVFDYSFSLPLVTFDTLLAPYVDSCPAAVGGAFGRRDTCECIRT